METKLDIEIRPMITRAVEVISKWKYEEPYSIYSMNGSEKVKKELMNGTYYSVYNENNLIGYYCFGRSAQVPAGDKFGVYKDSEFVDIGLGLKPDLCGQGLGTEFVRKGLDYGYHLFLKNKYRLTVAEFNKRAFKVYKKLGFETKDSFETEIGDGIRFIVMTKSNKE